MSRIEPEVLSRLFREHAPALLLYARQWSEAPEDLVQDAFVRLSIQRRPPDRVSAWLHRVVRNAALDERRGRSRRKRREEIAATTERWFADPGDGIDAAAATDELSRLEHELREIIVARLWGGLTFEETARLVDKPLTHVHRRYRQGLDELKRRLEGRCCPNSPTT